MRSITWVIVSTVGAAKAVTTGRACWAKPFTGYWARPSKTGDSWWWKMLQRNTQGRWHDFQDPRIRYLRRNTNGGAGAATNTASDPLVDGTWLTWVQPMRCYRRS